MGVDGGNLEVIHIEVIILLSTVHTYISSSTYYDVCNWHYLTSMTA